MGKEKYIEGKWNFARRKKEWESGSFCSDLNMGTTIIYKKCLFLFILKSAPDGPDGIFVLIQTLEFDQDIQG